MRTLTATIAAALGCILTAHAQVAVSPGYTPYMATVFLATNSTHAKALLEVSSGIATNLASGLHATNLAVLESGGALLKLFGAIGDGEYLKRDGTNVVGGSPSGSGDMTKAVYDVGDDGAVDEAAHATNADLATEASHATNADFATEASHATNADLATSATYAGLATNATYAANATNLVAGATGADLTLSGALAANGSGVTSAAITGTNTIEGGIFIANTNIWIPEGGGTWLELFGNIADGEYLKRDGTNVVGGTPAGAGDFMADGSAPMTGVFDAGDNALTNVSAFYGDAVTASNTVSTGELTVETNATVKGDAFIGNDLTVTNDATVTGDLSVGGTLTVDEVDTDKLVITNSLTVSNMYVKTMVVTNAISGGSLSTTTNVTTAAVTGTNSGTFGTLLSVTNAAITWGVEAVTQSGGTNYTLPFAGTASYPNTYLAYTMTGNVCFEFTTNRAAGRCRSVILYGNGKKGRLDFNSDNHLVGTLANGIVVTNTYILSFFTGGTDETNVFISGQYAE